MFRVWIFSFPSFIPPLAMRGFNSREGLSFQQMFLSDKRFLYFFAFAVKKKVQELQSFLLRQWPKRNERLLCLRSNPSLAASNFQMGRTCLKRVCNLLSQRLKDSAQTNIHQFHFVLRSNRYWLAPNLCFLTLHCVPWNEAGNHHW